MKTILRDLMERGFALDEASDIPDSERERIIFAWRSSPEARVYETFMEPADPEAESLLETIARETGWIASGSPYTAKLANAITSYWWRQIEWRVNQALQELQSEMRQERKDEEREFKLYGVAV